MEYTHTLIYTGLPTYVSMRAPCSCFTHGHYFDIYVDIYKPSLFILMVAWFDQLIYWNLYWPIVKCFHQIFHITSNAAMNISLHVSSNTCAKTALAEKAWSETELGEGMQIFSLLGIDKLLSTNFFSTQLTMHVVTISLTYLVIPKGREWHY